MNFDKNQLLKQLKPFFLWKLFFKPQINSISTFENLSQGTCQVCYCDEQLITTSCNHNLCRDCSSQYVKTQIKDENVYPVKCFGVGCDFALSVKILNLAMEFDKDTERRYKKAEIKNFVEVSLFQKLSLLM